MNKELNAGISPESRYYEYCAPGTGIEEKRFSSGNDVSLNCVTFTPRENTGNPPVIFVPGLASVIDNFTETLKALTERFTVHYIETRDKSSSIITGSAGFTVRDVASDILSAIDTLDLEAGKFLIVAYSIGSTASAEAFRSVIRKNPLLMVLIAPNARFRFPRMILFIARYFAWTFNTIKPLLIFYIKKFHVNTKDDSEMHRILVRVLNSADPRKLSSTVLGISEYEIWDVLKMINVPVLVVGASYDTFHNLDDARDIALHINGAEYVDMETNKRTHSQEVCDLLVNYLEKVT